MTVSEADRVGSYSSLNVNSDDEYGIESDNESYTGLDLDMWRILKVGFFDKDDEVIQEFDRARGQTRKDIYTTTCRSYLDRDSDIELEEDKPQPKRIKRSTKAKEPDYHCDSEDIEKFEDEIFTPEKYKEDKDMKNDDTP